MEKKRIALIVGHTAKRPGATNYLGESEYAFNSRIARDMEVMIEAVSEDCVSRIFYRDGVGRSGVADKVIEWKADLSIELHFNSFAQKAKGCEILVLSDDRKSIDIADQITTKLSEEFGIVERHINGVKRLIDGNRGYYNLKLLQTIPINILIEPCFANMKTKESQAIFENENRYVDVLAKELIIAVNGTFIPRTKEQEKDSDEPLKDDLFNFMMEFYPEILPKGSAGIIQLILDQERRIEKLTHIIDGQKEAWDGFCGELTDAFGKATKKSEEAWFKKIEDKELRSKKSGKIMCQKCERKEVDLEICPVIKLKEDDPILVCSDCFDNHIEREEETITIPEAIACQACKNKKANHKIMPGLGTKEESWLCEDCLEEHLG